MKKFKNRLRTASFYTALMGLLLVPQLAVSTAWADNCPAGQHWVQQDKQCEPDKSSSGSGSNCDPQSSGTCSYCANNPGGVANGNNSSKCVACNNGYCKDPAANPSANCSQNNGCDLVAKYVNPAINLLSMLVGLIAVLSIIAGAIQFITSEGDSQKAAAARARISKSIMAIFAFAFLYAFLQFLIPGGIFHK